MLTKLYRAFLPERIRRPLWHLRTYLGSVGRADRRSRGRSALADLYRTFGLPIHTRRVFGRLRLSFDLRDRVIGEGFFVGDEYDPVETAFVRSAVGPGAVFVDIGANVGYYSVLAASLTGPSGRVYAFEPEPHNFGLLARNLRQNGFAATATPVHTALGDAGGSVTLWKSDSNFGDHRVTAGDGERVGVTVPISTFDAWAADRRLDRIDFLKVDVQGYEARVFAGMARTLDRTPPAVILMEFWPDGIRAAGDDPLDMLRQFASRGYNIATLRHGGELCPVQPEAVFDHLPQAGPAPSDAFLNLVLRRPG